jgi:large subunit ribosomal protein L17
MRHGNAGRRLGRKTSHRVAMFRNMVTVNVRLQLRI